MQMFCLKCSVLCQLAHLTTIFKMKTTAKDFCFGGGCHDESSVRGGGKLGGACPGRGSAAGGGGAAARGDAGAGARGRHGAGHPGQDGGNQQRLAARVSGSGVWE